MGRKPFTEGEIKTLAYLEKAYQDLGIEPGNGDSYFQEVPMVSIFSKPATSMTIKSKEKTLGLKGFGGICDLDPAYGFLVDHRGGGIGFCGIWYCGTRIRLE